MQPYRRRSRQPAFQPGNVAADQVVGRNLPAGWHVAVRRHPPEVSGLQEPVEGDVRQLRAAKSPASWRMGRTRVFSQDDGSPLYPARQGKHCRYLQQKRRG